VIVPNWDGVNGPNGYESKRAVMMSSEGSGYIGMVADIYGIEYTDIVNDNDMSKKMELSGKYRSEPSLFVGRIQAAINVLLDHPSVDNNYIFVAGYCFGGSGAMDYAFADPTTTFDGVKAVVPIHGGLNPLRGSANDTVVKPYLLVLSGGVDDSHGNTTELEMHLDSVNATWEITRYSNAQHGFTEWGTGAYQQMADSRSWWSMMSLFDSIITADTMDTADVNDVDSGENADVNDVDSGGNVVVAMENDGGSNDDNNDSSASSFGISMIVAIATVTIIALL